MPTNLLLLLLLSFLILPAAATENVNLEFPFFTFSNLTLLGDSYLQNGVVGLTRELHLPSSSSGSAVYTNPITLFDPDSGAIASFSTKFSFSIDNNDPSSFGDGLAFFLSPNNHTHGGYLGLVNSSKLTKNRFLAVEFDTKMDLAFDDPDDNHVGFDIDSLVSIKTANPISRAINLKSGNLITAWIDYHNDQKKVDVFLSYSSFKPGDPLLSVGIDLADYLKDFMFVGFSASTNRSTEQHFVQNWIFQTAGLRRVRTRTHPYNVSDSSVSLKTPAPYYGSSWDRRHHRIVRFGFRIGVPTLFSAVVVVLGWLAIVKLKAIKSKRALEAELVTGPRHFTYKELKAATEGFHPSRILGHGAFGTVYKAFSLEMGIISAVKKSKHSHQGKAEFLAELSIIAYLRHKNLVQLQGWCAEKGELLLVYEFMPNGSLDKVLYPDPETEAGNPLKWPYRYNIAVGLASALSYLHQECEQQVIHRDVKASNIMLDGSYNPKLGDFGLARLMDHGQSPVSTLTAGTMGYLAPEYLQFGKATEKTDVFSYGVVILELACGRRPIEREGDTQRMVNLVDWVWKLYTEGNLMAAADPRMEGEFDEAGMKKMLLVGLSCANPDSAERPSMRRVFQILNDEAELVLVPKVKPRLSFSDSVPISISDIVSEFEADLVTT
ncbi:probable L-type lectin-domain containing receptor kinase S.7 [Andrographis paniculata]|uniref:probable L-type lectin-domain containing receptor kinase S.7 n=1 Tax=Andrographis paniculata TaxID=175694 RepID=UPI0021E783AC|nr:probable L-type lectin-domain containing receptor kinase S.7 [Andrographis paniculata]